MKAGQPKRQPPKTIALPKERMAVAEELFPEVYRRDSARGIFALRALARMFDDRANGWLAPFGLNAAQLNYLTVLYFAPAGLTLRELSLMVHTSNSAVTPIVNILERQGLVKRRENPADGRSAFATITRKGRALVDKAFPAHHGNIERGLALLTLDERRTLADLLEKVALSFDAAFENRDPG